jgi:hypothetical protein
MPSRQPMMRCHQLKTHDSRCCSDRRALAKSGSADDGGEQTDKPGPGYFASCLLPPPRTTATPRSSVLHVMCLTARCCHTVDLPYNVLPSITTEPPSVVGALSLRVTRPPSSHTPSRRHIAPLTRAVSNGVCARNCMWYTMTSRLYADEGPCFQFIIQFAGWARQRT